MVEITITALIPTKSRKKGAQFLRVKSVQQRTLVPQENSTLTVVIPPSNRKIDLEVFSSKLVWYPDRESCEVKATAEFDALKFLAIVGEWELIEGLEELSEDQQSIIRCRQGLCGHDHQRKS